MPIKKFLLVAIILTPIIWGIFGREPESNDSEAFKVGIIADESGFMSGHGQSIIFGAKVAAEKLNRNGGVLGKKVQLYVLDGQSDPSVTSNRARELLGKYGVSLLIGTGTSAATLAAISSASESNVPFIYSLDGEIKTCAPGAPNSLNPFVFASGFTERMAVNPLLKFLAGKVDKPVEQTKVYFIGGDYVYPRTTNEFAIEIARSLGLQVIGTDYSDTATTDYSPLIRKIQSAKPDILIVTNPGSSGVTFMKQARQFGLDQDMLISGFATFDQETIRAMGDASDGVYVVNRYTNTLQNAENIEFVNLFRAKYPNDSTLPGPTAAAGAYGALLIAAKAIEKVGHTDAATLASALPGTSMSLPQGLVTVDSANHVFRQPLYLMKIEDQSYTIISETQQLQHSSFEGCSVK